MAQHPHLLIPSTSQPTRYTSPSSGPREHQNLPQRSREAHAESLIAKLQEITTAAASRADERRAFGSDSGLGI